MRALLLLPVLMMVAACEPAISRRPLLSEGGSRPEAGLWAVLEPGCPTPSSEAVQTWSECAMPVWVGSGQAVTIQGRPVRSELVVADGAPRIAQFEMKDDAGDRRYGYLAFRTLDAPPHRSALVWFVFCEGGRGVTKAVEDEAECLVEDEGELRRLARAAESDPDAAGRAVFMGSG